MPRVSRLMTWACHRYLRRYFRRHFHAVAVSFAIPLGAVAHLPLVVFGNHASWWDPLFGLILARAVFPERSLYAPIDAEALGRYPILRRMGFFGVSQASLWGAAEFLRVALAILEQPNGSLWLTPEGRFTDPREVQVGFEPGLAHLASRMQQGVLLPVAVEYPFWEERLPEALGRFGEPILVERYRGQTKQAWQEMLQGALRGVQQDLAAASVARRSEEFQILVRGKTGVGSVYDLMRRAKARLDRQPVRMQHGSKLG